MNKYLTAIFFISLTINGISQKKDTSIGSEVVNVIGIYTPTISDAFKVKETPSFYDETITNKEKIDYSIALFPVASTFTPEKGNVQTVEKSEKKHYFNNFVSLGMGSYGTFLGELYLTQNINQSQYIGGIIKHHSSQGGIKEAVLDDYFYDTSVDVTYVYREKEYHWNVDLGYKDQIYNWYGLPVKYLTFNDSIFRAIDEKQTYGAFYLGGKLGLNQSVFNGTEIYYKRFWDGQKTTENRFWLKPSFDVDIAETQVKIDVIADYVGTDYQKNHFGTTFLKYSYFNFGFQPSFIYQQDDLSVKIGAGLFYSIGKRGEESDNKFRIYPQIQASYRVVGDLMIAYAGAEGTLQQNSYADFVAENPFVSPNQTLIPTDKKYDIFVGLKGKLANNIAYNLRASYKNENEKPMYFSGYDSLSTENYGFGNSLFVLYDDLKTLDLFGELKAEINKNSTIFANANLNSYSNSEQEEAWYMPSVRFSIGANIAITERFLANLNVFYIGQRKAKFYPNNFTNAPIFAELDGYVDINFGLNYNFNQRLSLFLKAHNLTDKHYEKWLNYPTQGIQILGGASYKFDF